LYLNGIREKPKLVSLLNKKLSWCDKVYLNALKWNIKILKHVSFEPLHWTYSYLMRPIRGRIVEKFQKYSVMI